ncbi:MAG: hypothetical protein D6781_11005 [Verrucomicrobia bacterium]|nr:MAG: hypothetical protein D6781_11005 [Verrucomicrobiota bacterium]
MNVILLTVFVGFVLVSLFAVLFLQFRRDAETSSPERDSLMPFEEEFTLPADRSGAGGANAPGAER